MGEVDGKNIMEVESMAPEGHEGPWQPKTLADVEWALERIGEAEDDSDQITRQAEAAFAVIEARLQAIRQKHERKAQWFRSLVEAWAVEHRGEVVRGKAKSRDFLAGSVGFRAKAEAVKVTDEAALLEWAGANHRDLVRMKMEVDKKALASFVKSTGEIPPGVDVEPATETVVVKTSPLPTLAAGKKELTP